jgi:hypothetical protein
VTVGAGGVAATGVGGNGTASSFGTFAVCPGGTGGATRSLAGTGVYFSLGAEGGGMPTVTGATTVAASAGASGNFGMSAEAGAVVVGGTGGNTPYGGARGVANPTPTPGTGAGGMGVGAVVGASPQTGGTGGSGSVTIYEYA